MDVGGDWKGEFNVVWWCGMVGVRVAAFVWRWVVGVLGRVVVFGSVHCCGRGDHQMNVRSGCRWQSLCHDVGEQGWVGWGRWGAGH